MVFGFMFFLQGYFLISCFFYKLSALKTFCGKKFPKFLKTGAFLDRIQGLCRFFESMQDSGQTKSFHLLPK
ncbi:hypothetical protein A3SI_18679 [Nitritalea halalkaliphila LW7]|uniref:Uncharacterized protein n=1 Tax=Nitritalea halalkaliphila LW7 TaxID=1189621 RepID=I5BTY3_9BACT|nr:hypothetical protein A3SI_18679 [Nitritalea halalkaliphila LW7]